MHITVNEMEFIKFGLDINDPNFSEIAVNYIQDYYFNGADSTVIIIFIAKCQDDNTGLFNFDFELIPN